MERAGIRADVRVFNVAINACAQVQWVNLGGLGMFPLANWLDQHWEAGESERALQLLDSMPDAWLRQFLRGWVVLTGQDIDKKCWRSVRMWQVFIQGSLLFFFFGGFKVAFLKQGIVSTLV